jgi:hypothetical protein
MDSVPIGTLTRAAMSFPEKPSLRASNKCGKSACRSSHAGTFVMDGDDEHVLSRDPTHAADAADTMDALVVSEPVEPVEEFPDIRQ